MSVPPHSARHRRIREDGSIATILKSPQILLFKKKNTERAKTSKLNTIAASANKLDENLIPQTPKYRQIGVGVNDNYES